MCRSLAIALLVSSALLAQPYPESESWIDSPEAYFATERERREWNELATREERDAFRRRYWARRDPTPGTEQNEFRDVVLGRIRTADASFGIGQTPGSRTSRGYLFIVFGSPSRSRQTYAAAPEAPRAGEPYTRPVGTQEGTETVYEWTWDRERRPELMKILERPRLDVTIIVEPNRRTDRIENPGLVHRYRELLAETSIVKDRPAPLASAPSPVAMLTPASDFPLEPEGSADPPDLGWALVWTRDGTPRTIFWSIREPDTPPAPFAVRLQREQGAPRTWSGSPGRVDQLLTSSPAEIWAAVIAPPPGRWSGVFATGETAERFEIDVPSDGTFGVSSLLLSGGPLAGSVHDPLIDLGDRLVPIRADATFTRGESLWYFLQLRSDGTPSVTVEPRLMKRGAGIVAASHAREPELAELSPAVRVLGYELPLGSFEPGVYTLYVTVRTADGATAVRRADFQVADR